MPNLGAGLPANCLLTVNPLGDSITAGAGCNPGDSTKNTGYRNPLVTLCTAAGLKVFLIGNNNSNHDASVVQVFHDGVGGNLISGIKASTVATMPQQAPEVVLMHAGTNDIQSVIPPATIAASLDDLILTCWNLGQRPGVNRTKLIEVAQITDCNGRTAQVADFNSRIPALVAAHFAAGRNVKIVDMFSALGPNPGTNFNGASQPHPNEFGYQIMAQKWFGTPGSGLLCDYGR